MYNRIKPNQTIIEPNNSPKTTTTATTTRKIYKSKNKPTPKHHQNTSSSLFLLIEYKRHPRGQPSCGWVPAGFLRLHELHLTDVWDRVSKASWHFIACLLLVWHILVADGCVPQQELLPRGKATGFPEGGSSSIQRCHRAAASAAAARRQEGVCSVTDTLPCSKRAELLCPRECLLCFLLCELTGHKPLSVPQMGGKCSFAWGSLSLCKAGVTYFLLYSLCFECCLSALVDLTQLATALWFYLWYSHGII